MLCVRQGGASLAFLAIGNHSSSLIAHITLADEWYAGELESGEQGIFPANFVEVIEPLSESKAAPAPAPSSTTITPVSSGVPTALARQASAGVSAAPAVQPRKKKEPAADGVCVCCVRVCTNDAGCEVRGGGVYGVLSWGRLGVRDSGACWKLFCAPRHGWPARAHTLESLAIPCSFLFPIASTPALMPAEPYAIAVFDFEAQEGDELSFFKDERIVLLEKGTPLSVAHKSGSACALCRLFFARALRRRISSRLVSTRLVGARRPYSNTRTPARAVDAEWYRGRTPDGNEGIFPKDFVEVKVDIPEGGAPAGRYVICCFFRCTCRH